MSEPGFFEIREWHREELKGVVGMRRVALLLCHVGTWMCYGWCFIAMTFFALLFFPVTIAMLIVAAWEMLHEWAAAPARPDAGEDKEK